MSQGESLITILLAVIAYLLYQIARQLTVLTGRKMRSPFSGMLSSKTKFKPHPKPEPETKNDKLPN